MECGWSVNQGVKKSGCGSYLLRGLKLVTHQSHLEGFTTLKAQDMPTISESLRVGGGISGFSRSPADPNASKVWEAVE